MKQRLLQKEPYVSIWHTLFLASPLTIISVFRNCCTTIMRSSYNRFSMKLDMCIALNIEIWCEYEEGRKSFVPSLRSSPHRETKPRTIMRSQIRANEIRWFWRGISVNACKRQTGKLIIYLSFHRCFTIVSIWRTRGRLSCESKRRLIIQ